MVQDPVQHRGGKHRISHHLCPVNDLFVGGKDDGTGFIGVADKCEKTIRLSAADRSVANLIMMISWAFLIFLSRKPAARSVSCSVEDLDQAGHLLKTYRIAAVDSLQPQTTGYHSLAEARRPRKDKVSASCPARTVLSRRRAVPEMIPDSSSSGSNSSSAGYLVGNAPRNSCAFVAVHSVLSLRSQEQPGGIPGRRSPADLRFPEDPEAYAPRALR